MTDTAQPQAAESDGFVDAANAFKIALGQADPIDRPRDADGPADPDDDHDDHELPADADALLPDDDDDVDAADPAQPDAVAMPNSWSKDDAVLWDELPPEAQARIAEREGQRDQAVYHKFQEAANARRVGARPFDELITHGQSVTRDQAQKAGILPSFAAAAIPGLAAKAGYIEPTTAALPALPGLSYLVDRGLLNKVMFERPEALRKLGRGARERAYFGGLFGSPLAIQGSQD